MAEVQRQPMGEFAERAYLDYSMYVVLDRALPHVGDGLKPVQRRIVYAMSDLGLHAAAKYKKSARTVGDVLGKFHPHGDTACYEAMVLMAQPFSYRYPLIDGQGNWGAQDDPKSFAAMRYTEARLTRYAQVLLEELGQGTVDWAPNFDGTLSEPKLLPARLPNALLNGATGIAVGMATDIPPHNMREVVKACLLLLDNPSAGVDKLCELVPAPDFPTEAEIVTPADELKEIYRTGNGSVRQRAVWTMEGGDIVINALPYQVSGSRVLEQIAQQMNAKKLPMVTDLRDESDHENPIRIVIEPRSNRVDSDELMQHLFATTDLERSYRCNFNLIGLDGRPRMYTLVTLLTEWLSFRKQTVTRRLEHRLGKVVDRLHVLDGLLIAYLNIDEVIRIIRNEDDPKAELIARFSLTEIQADAILDLRLRHLARLEEVRITAEQKELAEERDWIEKTLKSSRRLKSLIKQELETDAEEYGDPRRSPIEQRPAARALDAKALIPAEPVTVVLSQKGWIRAGKGTELDPASLSYRSGDTYLHHVRGKTSELLVCLDTTGRSYALTPHELPSARSLGEPLASALTPPAGAGFAGLAMGGPTDRVLLATTAGYGFVGALGDMETRNKKGKALLRPTAGAGPMPPFAVPDGDDLWVAVATDTGRMLVVSLAELPELPKGKGVKIQNIPAAKFANGEERMVAAVVFREGDRLKVHAGRRHLNLRPAEIDEYLGERAQRGRLLPRGFRAVNRIDVEPGNDG